MSTEEVIVPDSIKDSMDVDSSKSKNDDPMSSLTNSMAVFSELNDDESNTSMFQKRNYVTIGTQAII